MAEVAEGIRRHFAAFEAKDPEAEPFSADARVVAPGVDLHGREEVLNWLRGYWDAFPDARLEVVRSIASGPLTAVEGKLHGTHTGVLRTPGGEVPPTGRQVEIRWMAMYETSGDELVTEHLYFDSAEFMQQLGLVEAAPAEATAGSA